MPNSQPEPPRRPTEREETVASTHRERERGLWNYLVWSFFIAQIIGKGDLLGGPAKAGDDVDLNSTNVHDDAGRQAEALKALAPVAGTENGTTPPINTVLDAETSLAPTDGAQFGPSADEIAIQLADLARGGETVAVADTQDLVQGSPGDPGSPVAPGSPPEVGPGPGPGGGDGIGGGIDLGPLPGIGGLLDPILDTVGNVLPPVVELVDDLLGTVGGLLPPVVALADDLLGTVGSLLRPVVALADDLLGKVGDVVPTLLALADDLPGPLGGAVPSVLGLAESLPDIIDVAAEGPLQIVLSTTNEVLGALDSAFETPLPTVVATLTTAPAAALETALATASKLLDDATGPAQHLLDLGGADDAPAAGDVVASAGSIPFNVLTSLSGIVVDDLFKAGQYTEYNLSLQAEATLPAVPGTEAAEPGGNVASLLDHLIGDAQSGGDTHHASAGLHIGFGLPSAMDDFLFRGNDLAA